MPTHEMQLVISVSDTRTQHGFDGQHLDALFQHLCRSCNCLNKGGCLGALRFVKSKEGMQSFTRRLNTIHFTCPGTEIMQAYDY